MNDYDPMAAPVRKRSIASLLLLPLIAFLLGMAAMAWTLVRWDRAAELLGIGTPAPVAAPPAPVMVQQPLPALAGNADPELTRRLTLLEQRIGAIDTQTREAVGNADRAEGLLVAFAARRALDRGVALGYLEGLLRQRFGTSQPQAVGMIITASREPVTLEELQEDLQEAGPQLTGAGADRNWWRALQAELAGLVTVRKRGTPSTFPAERLRRASERLEAGQVDVALAEVLRMPTRDAAADWIRKARRYVGARRALDRIETAALLDPRGPPTGVPEPLVTPRAPQ